jgi:hypothetical protein
MRLSTRLSAAAALIVIAATAACGSDSTGPPGGGGSTPGTLAQHVDTLYQHAKATSVGDTNFVARTELISNLELAAAFGAAPTSVTVTTSAGTETWKGFVFEELHPDTNGSSVDSAYFVVVYRDSLVHTMVLAGFLPNGTSLGIELLANDTLVADASTHSGSTSITSVGSSCATPIAGLVNPIIATAQGTTCLSAVFSSSLALTFPAHAGVDPALTAFSFSTTSFAGERFSDVGVPGNRVHLSTLLLERKRGSH